MRIGLQQASSGQHRQAAEVKSGGDTSVSSVDLPSSSEVQASQSAMVRGLDGE
jgi:hypothetical protein